MKELSIVLFLAVFLLSLLGLDDVLDMTRTFSGLLGLSLVGLIGIGFLMGLSQIFQVLLQLV